MAGRQEILVVCLVESSVTLLHEWVEVRLGYLSPVLQRIASAGTVKGVKNEIRIGFVSYSDPHVHPNPILAKRFFSPPFQLTKELKDDPGGLGLGRTTSGCRRGMAVLEGYVAVLEMFDAIPDTRPPLRPSSNETQPDPSIFEPICYLIHIASSPPNKAKNPSWNTDPALDAVTWESLPSHLLKRKIRTSMILTRPVTELQDLYSHLSHTPEPFWLPMSRSTHKIFLSGLPPLLKEKTVPQKRAATANPEPPPPPIRQAQEQSAPTSAAVAPSTAPNPPSARPVSVASSHASAPPAPQPASQLQLAVQQAQTRPNPASQNFDPVKLVGYIRNVEIECRVKLAAISQARAAGKSKAELDIMQGELNQKLYKRQRLVSIYQQVIARQQQPNGGQDSTSVGLLQQTDFRQPPGQGQTRSTQEQPAPQATQPNPTTSVSGQGPQTSPGGTATHASFAGFGGPSAGSPFQNPPTSVPPGLEAQLQKMLADRARPQLLAATPQSQPPPHNAQIQATPTQGNANTNATPSTLSIAEVMTPRMNLGPNIRRWQGVLAWPSTNTPGRTENQIAIAFFAQDANLRCESWPQKLLLQPSRGALMNTANVQAWIKESNPVMGLISHTPIVGNFEATAQNMRMFRSLRELIQAKNLLAYCKFDIAGSPPGTGMLAFPTNSPAQGDFLVAMVFNKTPLPAVITAHIPAQTQPADAGTSSNVASTQQAMSGDAPPLTMPNMSAEAKAFLQQRQAAALAAYNQQQVAHQQHQAQQLVPNPPGGNSGPGSAFDVAQFMQNIRAGTDNPGGQNLQPPQPVQNRQPSAFNPNVQMLQYLN